MMRALLRPRSVGLAALAAAAAFTTDVFSFAAAQAVDCFQNPPTPGCSLCAVAEVVVVDGGAEAESEALVCTACVPGLFLDTASGAGAPVCAACAGATTGCTACDAGAGVCTRCGAGLYLHTDGGSNGTNNNNSSSTNDDGHNSCKVCAGATAGCAACDGGATCTACIKGYFLQAAAGGAGAACVPCGPHCRECNASGVCLQCDGGAAPNSAGQCSDAAPRPTATAATAAVLLAAAAAAALAF